MTKTRIRRGSVDHEAATIASFDAIATSPRLSRPVIADGDQADCCLPLRRLSKPSGVFHSWQEAGLNVTPLPELVGEGTELRTLRALLGAHGLRFVGRALGSGLARPRADGAIGRR